MTASLATRLAIPAVLGVLALSLSACGSDDDQTDQDKPSDAPTSDTGNTGDTGDTNDTDMGDTDTGDADAGDTEPAGDACAFASAEDLSAAAGQEIEAGVAGPELCFFTLVGPDTDITINYTKVQLDLTEYIDGTREACDDEATDVDAEGDTAFVCETYPGAIGYRFDDTDLLTVVVTADPNADAAGLESARELAARLVPVLQYQG